MTITPKPSKRKAKTVIRTYKGFAVQLVRQSDGETFFATGATTREGAYAPGFYWKRKNAVAHKKDLIDHGLGPCKVVPAELTIKEIIHDRKT